MSALEILQDLLRIPSYSGQEGPIQQHIKDLFTESGINAIFQDENLVVHLEGIDTTRAFIFNSHVDVVHVANEAKWTHGPWSADVVDRRVYGRGASDMKSGVAASIETAKVLAQAKDLPCDVWFTYVVKEEEDGSGTKSFAKWFRDKDYTKQYREIAAVFTEPTNLDMAQYCHRGNFFIQAAIDGDAGHASRPREIKTHAIMQMVQFIRDLEAEEVEWFAQYRGSAFAPPTITPTVIKAGDESASWNTVANRCAARFDLRTVPGFHQEAFERVRQLAEHRGITLSLGPPDAPTGYTEPDAKIVRILQSLVPELRLEISEGSADLGFLTELGIEGVIFGPGEDPQSHTIDESVPVENVQRAPRLYEQLYRAWATA